MNLTIKQLDKELRELANAHVQINSYYFGDFLEIMSQHEVKQNSLLVNVNDAVISEKLITLNIALLVVDKIKDDKVSDLDVESDTLQILNDFVEVIKYSSRWQRFGRIDNEFTAIKVVEKGSDVLNGWGGTLQIKIFKNKNGVCDIPFIGYDYNG